jgi:hypothetical protein
MISKVRTSLRLLSMGVGALLLSGVVALWYAGDLSANVGAIGAVAGFFLLVGLGKLEDEHDSPASERFRELADPTRTLSPEDLMRSGATAREPVAAKSTRRTD